MTSIANKSAFYSALALAGLMAATRFHHFGSAFFLPDASLAVFFLAGLLVASPWFWVLLLAEAGLVDYAAISYAGVSDFCVSPAYVFLVPAYGAMWLGGRFSQRFVRCSRVHLLALGGILALSTGVSFLISDGSFYLFSGRYDDLAVTEYAVRAAGYFVSYLSAALVYGAAGYAVAIFCKVLPGVSDAHAPKQV